MEAEELDNDSLLGGTPDANRIRIQADGRWEWNLIGPSTSDRRRERYGHSQSRRLRRERKIQVRLPVRAAYSPH
jgi:hypothetical protein